MPKISEAAQEIQRSRPPRVAAQVKEEEDEDDLVSGMSRYLKEFCDRRSKKMTMANAVYENQKKAIYAAGRVLAQEIVRDAIRHFDNIEEYLLEVKKREWSYERYVAEVIPLWHEQDAAINKLLGSYDHPLDDIFPKRAETIASAEQILEENPTRRAKALKHFLGKAHEQLEESCRNEKAATDASKLIKHYKALLLA